MARVGIPPELIAAVGQPHVTAALLMDLQLSTGTIYLATTAYPITWNGNSYLGAAGIGTIEPMTETARGAVGMRFTLPLVNAAAIASAMTERIQGRPVILRALVVVDEEIPGVYAGPFPGVFVDPGVWVGKLDSSELDLYGEEPKLVVTAEHEMFGWDRPRNSRASHDEHMRRHPGDEIHKYMASTVGKRVVWPAVDFFNK